MRGDERGVGRSDRDRGDRERDRERERGDRGDRDRNEREQPKPSGGGDKQTDRYGRDSMFFVFKHSFFSVQVS